MKLNAITSAWNRFFFEPVSPLPFAVFRILYGALVLVLLCLQLFPDREFWYGANGIGNPELAVKYFWRQPIFDLLNLTGVGADGLLLFFSVAILAALFVTIGLGTRYSAWVLFMCLISLQYHFPWNSNGGDCFVRIAALFLACSQAGECLSVDRWWKQKYAPEKVVDKAWPWAQRLFQIQLGIVYWQTTAAKLSGDQWIDGTAIWYATRLDDLMRFQIPFLFDSLLMSKLFTWSTLVVEVSLWTLIWVKECRYWVLLAGFFLHAGIDIFLSLPLFEWVFMAAYITFVEPEDLQRAFLYSKNWLESKRNKMKSAHPPKSAPLAGADPPTEVAP